METSWDCTISGYFKENFPHAALPLAAQLWVTAPLGLAHLAPEHPPPDLSQVKNYFLNLQYKLKTSEYHQISSYKSLSRYDDIISYHINRCFSSEFQKNEHQLPNPKNRGILGIICPGSPTAQPEVSTKELHFVGLLKDLRAGPAVLRRAMSSCLCWCLLPVPADKTRRMGEISQRLWRESYLSKKAVPKISKNTIVTWNHKNWACRLWEPECLRPDLMV